MGAWAWAWGGRDGGGGGGGGGGGEGEGETESDSLSMDAVFDSAHPIPTNFENCCCGSANATEREDPRTEKFLKK